MVDLLPVEVSDVDVVFSAGVAKFMPDWDDIPEDFRDSRTPWNQLASRWFFRGLRGATFTSKEGVDRLKALRHLRCVISSFEPRHEHKEAAVAYLLSLWFERVTVDGEVYQ